MRISDCSMEDHSVRYLARQKAKRIAGEKYQAIGRDQVEEEEENDEKREKCTTQTSVRDQYERMHAKTESDIVVKPDGSRVLVVTMKVGEMETTMSMKISEPTLMPNDSADTTCVNEKEMQTIDSLSSQA